MPIEFNVSLLSESPNDKAIHSSKAVGEPPFFLGASVFWAIKDAIRSARYEIRVACCYMALNAFFLGTTATRPTMTSAGRGSTWRRPRRQSAFAWHAWTTLLMAQTTTGRTRKASTESDYKIEEWQDFDPSVKFLICCDSRINTTMLKSLG